MCTDSVEPRTHSILPGVEALENRRIQRKHRLGLGRLGAIGPQSRKDLFKISCVVDAIRGHEMATKSHLPNLENAEIIALKGLDYLAQDADRLGRFIALTGIGPGQLRSHAGTPAVLAGVLEYILSDESTLLVFCSLNAIAPDDIGPAHRLLADAAKGSGPDDTP